MTPEAVAAGAGWAVRAPRALVVALAWRWH